MFTVSNTKATNQESDPYVMHKRTVRAAAGVVVGGFIMIFAGSSMFLSCTSMFIVPLAEALNENIASISFMYTAMTLVSTTCSLFYYKIEKKLPIRIIASIGMLCPTLAFIFLGTAKTLIDIYISGLLAGFGLMCLVAVHGSITRWFIKKRATMNNLATMGGCVVGIIMSPITMHFISNHGYRSAAFILAGTIAVLWAISMFLIKDAPKKYGMLPYGAEFEEHEEKSVQNFQYSGISMKEAMRTKKYWLICIVLLLMEMVWRGTNTQITTIYLSKGLSSDNAVVLMQVMYFATTFWRLFYGKINRKFGFIRLVLTFCIIAAIGMIVAAYLNSFNFMVAFSICYSFLGAVCCTYGILAISRVFGPKDAPGLNGIANAFFNIGGALGPIILSEIFVLTGSYSPALILFACVLVFCAVLSTIVCRNEYKRS